MGRPEFKPNPKVRQIFDDLEKFREFCVDYGYKYDEKDLYDMRSYVYRQHQKQLSGKIAKDSWSEDRRP
mgnify:FL=1